MVPPRGGGVDQVTAVAALHLRVLVRSGLGQRGGGGYGGSLSLRQRQHHHDCQHDLQKPPTLHCCDFAVMTSSCLFFIIHCQEQQSELLFSLELQRREAAEGNSKLLGFASRVTGRGCLFSDPLVVITAVLAASPRRSVCSLTSSVSGGRRLGERWTEVTRNWLVAIHSGRGDSCLLRLGVGVEPRGRGVEGIVLYWHCRHRSWLVVFPPFAWCQLPLPIPLPLSPSPRRFVWKLLWW